MIHISSMIIIKNDICYIQFTSVNNDYISNMIKGLANFQQVLAFYANCICTALIISSTYCSAICIASCSAFALFLPTSFNSCL